MISVTRVSELNKSQQEVLHLMISDYRFVMHSGSYVYVHTLEFLHIFKFMERLGMAGVDSSLNTVKKVDFVQLTGPDFWYDQEFENYRRRKHFKENNTGNTFLPCDLRL